MITIGPVGDQGKISTPIDTSFALYKQCAIWNPGGIVNPLLLVTNGSFDITAPDPSKLGVATARIPVAWIFEERDLVENKEHNILDKFLVPVFKKASALVDYVQGNNDETMHRLQDEAKMVDVQYETINMVPRRKPVMYRDRMEIVIGFDKIFKATEEDELQFFLQDKLDLIRYNPKPVPIGYGFFGKVGKDIKLLRRPNRYFKIGSKTVVRLDPTTLDISNNEARRQALYMYLAGMALHRFLEGTDSLELEGSCLSKGNVNNWTIHDCVAIVTLLVSGIVGFGDTPTAKTWSSMDIQTTLDHIFGLGYSIANRLLWEPENFKNYYLFCLFLGYAMSRCKPITMDYQLVKYLNQDRLVTERFTRANHANFDSVGSISGMVLPMPRNDLKWKGESVFPFPVLMDMSSIESDREVLERANVYETLRQVQGKSFQQVEITRGELPPNVIDHKSTEQKWLSFKTSNDARIVEEEYEMRDIIKYKFPRWGIARNTLPDSDKRFLYVVGLFTNGDRALKQGYIADVSMQILTPVVVTYYRTSLLETAVLKEGSDTKTDIKNGQLQQPKPSAGMTGPAVIKREDIKADVPQPPVQEPIPEKSHSNEIGGNAENVKGDGDDVGTQ